MRTELTTNPTECSHLRRYPIIKADQRHASACDVIHLLVPATRHPVCLPHQAGPWRYIEKPHVKNYQTGAAIRSRHQPESSCTDSISSCSPTTSSKNFRAADCSYMAAAKLEDGDVKGAVRLLCSDDKLVIVNATTMNEISSLHPSAPADQRPAPSIVVSPL